MKDKETNVINPSVEIDSEILEQIKTAQKTEKQVIVNCRYKAQPFIHAFRIWKTTYLRDLNSSHKSKLLMAYNIPYYPTWKRIMPFMEEGFTLIFEALPKECETFDLFEDIPEAGGFYLRKIKRNKTDVYSVTF